MVFGDLLRALVAIVGLVLVVEPAGVLHGHRVAPLRPVDAVAFQDNSLEDAHCSDV